MQNLKALLADWILAPKTLSAVKYGISKTRNLRNLLNSINYTEEYPSFLNKNNKLRNLCQGKRCFVIGNGPSINRQDLSLLKNEVKIVCNSFFNHEILKEWQPTIYCAADPASSHSVSDFIPCFYENIFNKINPLFYVFHHSVVEELLDNDQIQIPLALRDKILMYAATYGLYQNNISEQTRIDLTKYIPSVRHTPMLSIMIGIYMGCNPIILIGCDHDYVYKLFRQEYEVEHFYPESTPEVIPKNSNHLLSIADDIFKTYSSYDKLNRIALKQGVRILDATDNGFLDTFNKIDYTSLFQHKGGVGK